MYAHMHTMTCNTCTFLTYTLHMLRLSVDETSRQFSSFVCLFVCLSKNIIIVKNNYPSSHQHHCLFKSLVGSQCPCSCCIQIHHMPLHQLSTLRTQHIQQSWPTSSLDSTTFGSLNFLHFY